MVEEQNCRASGESSGSTGGVEGGSAGAKTANETFLESIGVKILVLKGLNRMNGLIKDQFSKLDGFEEKLKDKFVALFKIQSLKHLLQAEKFRMERVI